MTEHISEKDPLDEMRQRVKDEITFYGSAEVALFSHMILEKDASEGRATLQELKRELEMTKVALEDFQMRLGLMVIEMQNNQNEEKRHYDSTRKSIRVVNSRLDRLSATHASISKDLLDDEGSSIFVFDREPESSLIVEVKCVNSEPRLCDNSRCEDWSTRCFEKQMYRSSPTNIPTADT